MNKKISLTVLLLTLTACGGGNIPNSSLSEIVNNPTIPTQNPETDKKEEFKFTIQTKVDNKVDIVNFIRNKGIDVSADEYDRLKSKIENFEKEENRSARSKKRNATTSSLKSELSIAEKEYRVANYKYRRAEEIAMKGYNKVKETIETAKDIVEDICKLFGLWKNDTSVNDIINGKTENEFKEIVEKEKDELENKMKLFELELKDVTLQKTLDPNSIENPKVNYKFDNNGNPIAIVYSEREPCGDNCFSDEIQEQVYNINKFKKMPNGVLTASIFSKKDAYAYFEKNEKGEFVRKSDFYHTEEELKGDNNELTDEYIESHGKILPLKYEEVESILFGGASINLSYSDFGILRLIVNDNETAIKALTDKDYLVKSIDVVGVKIGDAPGKLTTALDVLDKANINVEYLYAFMARTEKHAYVVLRVGNNAEAEAALENAGYHLITEADICKL